MGLFDILKLKKNKKEKGRKGEKVFGFYELDDTLYTLFRENENKNEGLIEVMDIANRLYATAERDELGEEEKNYASGIVNYIDYLISGDEEKLTQAIEKLSELVEKKEDIPHAHYFLGKAYYHKSFTSSDPLKYKSLSDFHLTKAEKVEKEKKESRLDGAEWEFLEIKINFFV